MWDWDVTQPCFETGHLLYVFVWCHKDPAPEMYQIYLKLLLWTAVVGMFILPLTNKAVLKTENSVISDLNTWF
jgi:hypothetical protein